MKYERYESVDGSGYKAVEGKDGITGDDMRVLKRVVKGSQKTEAKVNRLETVSVELVTEDSWQELDVAVLVEEKDEQDRLHKAIATLTPAQQDLIHKVYFQDIPVSSIARADGVSEGAIRDRLRKIHNRLKNNLI